MRSSGGARRYNSAMVKGIVGSAGGNFAVAAPAVAPTVDNSTSSQYTFHTGTVAPPQSGANLSETQRRMLKEFIDTIVEARKQHGVTLPPTQPAPVAPPPPTP